MILTRRTSTRSDRIVEQIGSDQIVSVHDTKSQSGVIGNDRIVSRNSFIRMGWGTTTFGTTEFSLLFRLTVIDDRSVSCPTDAFQSYAETIRSHSTQMFRLAKISPIEADWQRYVDPISSRESDRVG